MKSRNILTRDSAGFTLIEIVLVLALLAIGTSAGVALSTSTLMRASVAQERDTLASLLIEARTNAMHNVNGESQGLVILHDSFVLFAGVYTPTNPANITIARNAHIHVTDGTTITFSPLSGNTSHNLQEIVLRQDSKTATVTVNAQGLIDW